MFEKNSKYMCTRSSLISSKGTVLAVFEGAKIKVVRKHWFTCTYTVEIMSTRQVYKNVLLLPDYWRVWTEEEEIIYRMGAQ